MNIWITEGGEQGFWLARCISQSWSPAIGDPDFFSWITVFAYVGLVSQAENDLVAFENLMRSLPEVRECHMLSGEIDFLLKIVATNMDAFQRFLTGQLTCAPNVSQVKTSLAVRASFNKAGVPIPLP